MSRRRVWALGVVAGVMVVLAAIVAGGQASASASAPTRCTTPRPLDRTDLLLAATDGGGGGSC
ncbi:hypothetical protein [Streptomyces sp. Ag109_O5-1]|uniref:hypothetical protein n=1 Tax=Streptomyces sp. Ag109_O5-1 TaxID=1938851 RepID=UPI000F4F173F|nr:hypothetical protein [Streptomyces sp. Ag109_O5-1]